MSSSCRTRNAAAKISEQNSYVASETGRESESMSSRNAGMGAAVLSPGGVFDAHSSVLKATALQHGIQLAGELTSSSGCSMARGIRPPTPHHTTSRAAAPIDMVHIATAGPFQESLGGSRCVVTFVDSASRFQRPRGARDKSASTILGVVTRFVADIGLPRAFRTDNGAEYTNSTFVDYCNGLGIRRQLTAPYTPRQSSPVESGLSRAIKL